jgi:hypothetical protein
VIDRSNATKFHSFVNDEDGIRNREAPLDDPPVASTMKKVLECVMVLMLSSSLPMFEMVEPS